MGKITAKEKKFDAIYQMYADDIYRVCLHFCKNPDKAAQLMRQTFLEFYDIMEEIDPECRRSYLAKIAKHLVDEQEKSSEMNKRGEEI